MKEFEFVVEDPLGIHARPAGRLVKLAQEFESESILMLERTGTSASLKRLLALMSLGVKGGDRIRVLVNGKDEQQAQEAIERWLHENLG